MNNRKIALFVEGQTEYIFVREFLLKWYGYESSLLGYDCYTLYASKLESVNRAFGSKESENYYLIIRVNNDARVLSQILKQSEGLVGRGYSLVVGLRDMYCQQYRNHAKHHAIDENLNQKFKKAVQEEIDKSPVAANISFHFAIMEVEAWMLGLRGKSGEADPETTFFHPCDQLRTERQSEGKNYDKSESDVESVCSDFSKATYEWLLTSTKCQSFKDFIAAIV